MVAHGRSMLQVKVDENCVVLRRLIETIPDLIHSHFKEVEKMAANIATNSCDGDVDVYLSEYNSILELYRSNDEDWMILEFYRSMCLLVYSFAETTIRGLLKDPDEKFKNHFLCNAYNKLREENELKIKKIGQYWKGHQEFTQKRDYISHNRRDVIVTDKELLDAVDGVHLLLRTIADAFENKRKDESNSNLS